MCPEWHAPSEDQALTADKTKMKVKVRMAVNKKTLLLVNSC